LTQPHSKPNSVNDYVYTFSRAQRVLKIHAGYNATTGPFPAPRNGHPVFIALVDTTTTDEFLEHVKNALVAALEALPPNALVGIITLADHVSACPALFYSFLSLAHESKPIIVRMLA
jgi:hypothetical protein